MVHELINGPAAVIPGINILLQLLETKLFVNVTVRDLMEGRQQLRDSIILHEKRHLHTVGYTDPLIETASIVKPGVLRDNKFGILQAVRETLVLVLISLPCRRLRFSEKRLVLSKLHDSHRLQQHQRRRQSDHV